MVLLMGISVQWAAETKASSIRRFVITEHGAVGDGQTLNTKILQTAINRCAAEGGGVVVVPRGTFLSGAIFLKQGVNLSVEKDGVLKGSVNPEDYPQVKTRWEGIEREWTSALVNADGLTGVEVGGEGMIDGSGDQWTPQGPRPGAQTQNAPATGGAAAGSGVTVANPQDAPRRLGRPRLIVLQNCKQVRVSGLTLKNQACWGLVFIYCEDAVAEGLTIRAEHTIPSSDGIDVDSSRRVRIVRCDIDVNDDCISIKSGKDADGLRVNRPSEDIVIENCRFGYGHGGVAMGSETSGGIRNVEVRNCVAEAGNWAPIRFKSQPSRGGVVENITYRDIQLNDVRRAFEFNMEWRMVPPIAPPAQVLPKVWRVRLINITGAANSGGVIHGLKDSPIEDVTFENCRITAQKGLVIENARNVNVSGLALEVKEGEAVIKRGVE
jgi:polygalacturonase